MAMPDATPALSDLVDPNCVIAHIMLAAAFASADNPGPSWPNSSTHSRGSDVRSIGTDPSMLSMAMIGTDCSAAQPAKALMVAW